MLNSKSIIKCLLVLITLILCIGCNPVSNETCINELYVVVNDSLKKEIGMKTHNIVWYHSNIKTFSQPHVYSKDFSDTLYIDISDTDTLIIYGCYGDPIKKIKKDFRYTILCDTLSSMIFEIN